MCAKSVAIIGGGPSGIAAAKALSEENAFDRIVIFEQQEQLGGVWNYSSKKPGAAFVPSDSPARTREWNRNQSTYFSAMYEKLETNIVKDLMPYNNYPFPEVSDTLPPRQDVLEYLLNYAKGLNPSVIIRLNTVVTHLEKVGTHWRISYRQSSQAEREDTYQYIIIASGHYNFPYVPTVPGLDEWVKVDADSISHSMYYINNEKFRGKKVLVIGNAISGVDISLQLTEVTWPVYRSKRHEPLLKPVEIEDIIEVSEIAKYDISTRSATTIDGKIIDGIDHILFCTGYLYDFPFLKAYMSGEDAIITDGRITRRLYRQIFYIPDPTLSFSGVVKNVVPFPLAESQAAVIARVFSGRLSLPNEAEMRESEIADVKERGSEYKFHVYEAPADVEYINTLQQWVDQAEPTELGFKAEVWTEEKKQRRVDCINVKNAHHLKYYAQIKKLRDETRKD
ncbi:hypothetical protein LJB42_004696 [Komagataella kurtzmanii]|nr:hypothetical protein LJB42_004696 [Komagataella kurtzmanii]